MGPPNGVASFDDEEIDIDYSDIEAKYKVELEEGFDNILVVDGVPVIDKSKLEKLLTKVCKEFSKKGAHIKPDDIFVPWDDSTGKSKGFMFIEFKNADDAIHAISVMNGHPFDAKHTFYINQFADIERYANMDENYVEPEEEEFEEKEHLRSWLADPQGRDQYVTYRQDDVSIYWHGKPSQSELAYERRNWTDLYVSWSPMGTMLATLHRQGVRLWGGASWSPCQKFAHPLVTLIDFSPNERYLVTWSNEPIVIPEGAPQGAQYLSHDDEGNSIAVWDIKTGNLLRTFPMIATSPITGGEDGSGPRKQQMSWPALKWSPDDAYVARVTPGQQISVYELPGMGLLEKKSIRIDGVVDFEWCPMGDRDREEASKGAKGDSNTGKGKRRKENMLAYWSPEMDNQPARVSLMSIPSRNVLRSKNLFNVSECKLYWQNQGDFLCVKVDRHTKTKKSIFCNLEIFCVREKDFPVEVVELKDNVADFSWEPKGERFAIVSSSDPNLGNPGPGVTIKTDVSFYQLERGKGDFKLLKSLPGRTSNTIRWSPRGRNVVLATVGSSSKSELEFWDLDFFTDDISGRREGPAKEEWGAGISHLGTADHYGVTDVEWDPSGRYLATSASAWRHTLENGYAIWDFKGQEIQKQILDRFKQFLWRPRPVTLLSKQRQREIRKNLKEYSRQFDEEDAVEESNVSAELIALRKRLVEEWNAYRAKCRRELAEDKLDVSRGIQREDEEQELIEIETEEVLEETIEVVEE